MKTEDWEEAFREKVNGLDSPPPQTRWTQARSWGKLEKRLANQSEPDRRRIAWWVYVAAAIVLLIPAFLTIHHFNRQRHEIVQLKAELAKVKFPGGASVHSRGIAKMIAGKKVDASTKEVIAGTLPIQPLKRNRPVNREKARALASLPRAREIPVAAPLTDKQAVSEKPVLTDTVTKSLSLSPASATVVTILRKTSKAPVAPTVVFVFQGKEESQGNQLADAAPKPAKKFIFLSGEKEANPSTKPEEAQTPFLFTAKLKVNP